MLKHHKHHETASQLRFQDSDHMWPHSAVTCKGAVLLKTSERISQRRPKQLMLAVQLVPVAIVGYYVNNMLITYNSAISKSYPSHVESLNHLHIRWEMLTARFIFFDSVPSTCGNPLPWWVSIHSSPSNTSGESRPTQGAAALSADFYSTSPAFHGRKTVAASVVWAAWAVASAWNKFLSRKWCWTVASNIHWQSVAACLDCSHQPNEWSKVAWFH